MQQFFQYRRLRREVEEDLAHAERPAGSALGTYTIEPQGEETKSKESSARDGEFQKVLEVPGVTVSRPDEGNGSIVFEVGWKENDPSNPLNWTLARKWVVMLTCCALAIPLTMLTSIEGPSQDAFDRRFGVNAQAGSMTTGKGLPCHLASLSAK